MNHACRAPHIRRTIEIRIFHKSGTRRSASSGRPIVQSSLDYSLPDDDVEVIYLLKRGLAHFTDPKKITVVEYCEENPNIALSDHSVGRRYRALFGEVDWHAGGLDSWLNRHLHRLPIMLAPEDCVVPKSQEFAAGTKESSKL